MIKYKDTPEDWMARIDDGLEFRRLYGREESWARNEAMLLNLPKSGAEIGPNLYQEMSDAVISRLGVANPAITISPSLRDPSSVDSYRIVQAVDNWFMQELGVPFLLEDVAMHSFLWGRGGVKIGYDSEWGFDEAFDLGDPTSPWGMTLTQFAKKGSRIECGAGSPGMPWIMPVLPHDIVLPWGTTYSGWCPWIAHRVIRHVDLLKADPKYENTRDLQPDISMQDVMDSYTKVMSLKAKTGRTQWNAHKDRTKNQEFVVLWEIHNWMTGKVLAITEKKIHRNDNDDLQLDGLPFKFFTLMKHPRSFWGTPQGDYLRFHQAEQYDIALQAAKQRRVNVLKYLIKRNAMNDEELTKALSPEVGIAAFMEQSADMDRDIKLMPQGNNFLLWQEAEASRRNSREAIGFSRNQLGEFDTSSRRTAHEASFVNQGSERRMDRRQAAFARLYTEVFRFLNQTVFKFWKTPRHVQIEGGEWPSFTGEQIKAEYSYNIDFGVEQPRDLQTRRQAALQTYMMLREDPLVDPQGLRTYLARSYHDVEFEKLFKEGTSNASLSLPMSQMQVGAGGVQNNQQTQ